MYEEMFKYSKSVLKQYKMFRLDCPMFDPSQDYLVIIEDDNSNPMEIVGAFGRDSFESKSDLFRTVMDTAYERLENYPGTKFYPRIMHEGQAVSFAY